MFGTHILGFHYILPTSRRRNAPRHLSQVGCPMLFLQGTRDELAHVELIRNVTEQLGERAMLQLFADADHSFHVRARSGQTDKQVLDSMLDAIVAWITTR